MEITDLETSGVCTDMVELTSSGAFTLWALLRLENGSIPVPLHTAGTHPVTVTDTRGVEGCAEVTIPARTLGVDPGTARP